MGLERKQPRTTTRRTFLGWWMAAILTSTVVTVVAPLAVYIFPPRNPNQTKQKIRIALDTQVDALQEGGVSRFQAPAGMAFVMADGGEGNSAGDPTFAGYEFALDGAVLHGPATSPLSHLTWQTGPGANEIDVDGINIGS